MWFNAIDHATAMRPRFVAPTLGAAGEKSALVSVQTAPITGPIFGDAGMVTGHRPWSPLIT
jgi:hypothetical protein